MPQKERGYPTDREIQTKRIWDTLSILALIAVGLVFVVRYRMPFRLDDILLIEWSNGHHLLDAFDPIKGQIVNSVRPIFAITSWILTHTAGIAHPFAWHSTLVITLLIALVYCGAVSRFLSGERSSFQLTPLLYFASFFTILNVFFWFSDLTYGLELAFTSIAWYYGVRGLYKADLRLWLLGTLAGAFAILSKEPAIVLVHVVFLILFALDRRAIVAAWKASKQNSTLAIVAYLGLIAITAHIILVSPTRTNRFFALSDPKLAFYITDRIRYYSSIYSSIPNRFLLIFPVAWLAIYSGLRSLRYKLIISAVCGFILALFTGDILIGMMIVVSGLSYTAFKHDRYGSHARRLLPFAIAQLIAGLTLLVTVQLVKTQLTEIAFLSSIIAGGAWALMINLSLSAARVFIERYTKSDSPSIAAKGVAILSTLLAIGVATVIVVAVRVAPRMRHQEQLLSQVRDVRTNANDAIQWSAAHLPQNALLAVTSYSLYGISGPEALTGKSDEEKLHSQYTFESGYIFTYLAQLGRRDIQRAYIEDTLMLPRTLGAMRNNASCYLFLQSVLDIESFHRKGWLKSSDSLDARFEKGGLPCEIWKLSAR